MISALSASVAGMNRAAERFDQNAQRIAQSGSTEKTVDAAKELTEALAAQNDFKANAKVFGAAGRLTGTLLDIIA
jgi:flagellar hook protein FlgE